MNLMIWWGLWTGYTTTVWDIDQGEGCVKELIYKSLTMLKFELNFSRVKLKYLSVERAVEKLERESDLKPYTL